MALFLYSSLSKGTQSERKNREEKKPLSYTEKNKNTRDRMVNNNVVQKNSVTNEGQKGSVKIIRNDEKLSL